MNTMTMINLMVGTVVFTALILVLALLVLRLRSMMLPSSDVELRVNDQSPLIVKSGRKLLETLSDAGIAIPSACAGAGTCGLCKIAVTQGAGLMLPTEAANLSLIDQQQHMRLACQLTVREDLSVTVPSQILQSETWLTTVKSVQQLSPLIREIVLKLPDGEYMEFNPGAFVEVSSTPFSLSYSDIAVDPEFESEWRKMGVEKLHVSSKDPVVRAYSLANRPGENQQIVLLIRLALPPPGRSQRISPGIVSSWLFDLHPGDRVSVAGPYGDFRLHANEREMVLIGGGVGMAPLRSLIHYELNSNRQRSVSFFYGARSQNDIFYAPEFDTLQTLHERFHWLTSLSEPDTKQNWDGHTGFVHEVFQQEFLDDHPHPERCDYYVCGPPLMQQAVMAVLEDAGVDSTTIFADIFNE